MIKNIKLAKPDYSLLALASTIFLGFFFHYRLNPSVLFITVVCFALFYILWGFFHHLHLRNLSFKIMLEYFLIATLAIIIATALLL